MKNFARIYIVLWTCIGMSMGNTIGGILNKNMVGIILGTIIGFNLGLMWYFVNKDDQK